MGDERGERPLADPGGQPPDGRQDVADDDVGIERLDQRDRLARRLDGRLVRREVPPGGEDGVLRRRGELDPLALDVLRPAPPGLEADRMPAPPKRLAESDRREGVARIAEGRDQEAAIPPGDRQTISAISRIIRLRLSGSKTVGVATSVPTPASR